MKGVLIKVKLYWTYDRVVFNGLADGLVISREGDGNQRSTGDAEDELYLGIPTADDGGDGR